MSALRVTAWSFAAFFYAYQYILRVMPSVLLDDFMRQFHMNSFIFGQFSGVYYLGYSAMHIPLGIFLDRFGPRLVMPICIILTVVGLLPILFSDNWVHLIIGRALIGMGSSAAILGAFKIIRMLFVEAYFTRMLSFVVTIGLVGAIYGGGPLNYFCHKFGYKYVISLIAVIGILIAITSYIVMPKIEKNQSNNIFEDIFAVVKNKRVILGCVSAGLMVGPLEGFADVWGKTFLKEVYGASDSAAASLPSLIFIGMCCAPVLSFVAEKTKKYIGTIIGSGIIMAVSFFALITGKLIISIIGAMFFIVGICCAYQVIAIYKISTYVSENSAGFTTSMANMIIMIFGYFFHAIIGETINQFGGIGCAKALVFGISIIPVALCFGVLGFYFLYQQD